MSLLCCFKKKIQLTTFPRHRVNYLRSTFYYSSKIHKFMHFPFPPGSLKVRTTEKRSFYIIYVYLKKKSLCSELLIQRSKNLAENLLVMQVKTEKTSETHPNLTSDSFLSNLAEKRATACQEIGKYSFLFFLVCYQKYIKI